MDVKLRSYTDLRKGLTAEEAAARREKGEYNEQLRKTTKSYRMIFRDNLMTLFNLINVILAALVFITGNYRNMLFLGVIISNIVIGIFQEIRSKRVLDRLSLLSQTHVKALRDGRECELALDEIVMDDLLFLSNGDQIPCDAIVREGRLECNESLHPQGSGQLFVFRQLCGQRACLRASLCCRQTDVCPHDPRSCQTGAPPSFTAA